MKLDLHGVKHIDVSKELDSFLFKVLKSEFLQIEIITGKSSEMKKIVKECLVDYGLECSDELEGSLLINL